MFWGQGGEVVNSPAGAKQFLRIPEVKIYDSYIYPSLEQDLLAFMDKVHFVAAFAAGITLLATICLSVPLLLEMRSEAKRSSGDVRNVFLGALGRKLRKLILIEIIVMVAILGADRFLTRNEDFIASNRQPAIQWDIEATEQESGKTPSQMLY
jgi:hypothetical protein